MSDPLSPAAIAGLQDQLHVLQITTCIATATLGMYIWDICSNLADEYRLLLKSSSHPFPIAVYFVARLSSLGFILTHTLSLTARIENCHALSRATFSLVVIALSTVTLLFFLRLRAVYNKDWWISGAFFVLWLGNVACVSMSTLIFTEMTTLDFGGTVYCLEKNIRIKYAAIAAIGPLVHDTCVFLAISYRLHKNNPENDKNSNFRMRTAKYILGRDLPRLSKALFQDGQMLYLITLVASASTTILLYIPSIPAAYRLIADVPQTAILSALACSVFRNLRLGKTSASSSQYPTATFELPWHTSNFSTQTQIIALSTVDTNVNGSDK